MSMVNYQYPTTRELREINPEKIQNLTRDRPTFQIFPITDSQYWTLEWKQKDNWRGLQQLRGLNGEPSKVSMVGERAFSAEPGVYGEYMTVDEKMMTLRARDVPSGEPVNIDDLVLAGKFCSTGSSPSLAQLGQCTLIRSQSRQRHSLTGR
jgi:hypothetical protein